MKSVYFVYLQDQKHKRTITQSKNSAVEEKAAATKRCTLTQAQNRNITVKCSNTARPATNAPLQKIFARPRKKSVAGITIYVYTNIAY